ncbi:claudin-4 [Maylandia zebra]|uniref:Claudin n=1 Tax=Astatotilapia calliptera TaxID=8154 RepID=A0AAX7VI42_ASTCA|nr:claudin-4 [Maylandia zebra]XP_005932635.1 claudin-4 [Haplochromis burtoni]XP_026048290.1 claudin-4-like [Astatotilapia calliptera]
MPSMGLEILGVALAFLGWIFAIASCVLPMWKVTAFIQSNIITTETSWEGIWMECRIQSTGYMGCKIHYSMLDLSPELQAARALTILSILLGIVGLFAAFVGAKCTNCVDEKATKAQVMIVAGVNFILASLSQMIPVSWFAHNIMMDFHNSTGSGEKKDFGAALYLGWAAAAFLLIGGAILLCSRPQKPQKKHGPPSTVYAQPKSVVPSDYDRKDYV